MVFSLRFSLIFLKNQRPTSISDAQDFSMEFDKFKHIFTDLQLRSKQNIQSISFDVITNIWRTTKYFWKWPYKNLDKRFFVTLCIQTCQKFEPHWHFENPR